MKKFHPLLVTTVAALSLASVKMQAAKDSIVTSVFSSTMNGYKRVLDADGEPKPEFYAIANGRYLPGALKDRSIDDVKFPSIAGLVAEHLAKQKYFLAHDSKSAQLLLMITWGTTVPHHDGVYRAGMDDFFNSMNLATATTAAAADTPPSIEGIQSPESAIAAAANSEFEGQMLRMAMFEDMRMRSNEHNARLLGYMDEINYRNNPSRFAGAGSAFQDLITDIENERYFVIISAFDFKAAAKDNTVKPLWVTRVSIQKDGNRFDKALAAMVSRASDYFGSESKRLVRQYREGEVTFGELKLISYVSDEEEKADAAARAP
jgi:hypothetical protein